jgi:hypothetical protein
MVRFLGACEQARIDYWCYSGASGIGSAAYLHLCAAMAWIREPNQSLFRMQPVDIVQGGPFRPAGRMIPARLGDPSPIQYCLYIVKENRTYDQVLSDMPGGNGDTSLLEFGQHITPNHHSLASSFGLMDNFNAPNSECCFPYQIIG